MDNAHSVSVPRTWSPIRIKDVQPRDYGTWEMKCKNAVGACSNARYYVKCIKERDNKFVYGDDPAHSRAHSGCAAGTICKEMPFSQRLYDPQNLTTPLSCDEFPMAAKKQDDFKPGEIRNALRCINDTENKSKRFR